MRNFWCCLLAGLIPVIGWAGGEPATSGESIEVAVVGTLQSGIMAIGGETTGVTITAKGITWELDLGDSAELREAAESLSGSTVLVRGELERRAGVEIPVRWIVTVTDLSRPPEPHPGP